MTSSNFAEMSNDARPVFLIGKKNLDAARGDERLRGWIEQSGFSASPGELQLLPGGDGSLSGALFGVGEDLSLTPLIAGTLAKKLPAGDHRLPAGSCSNTQSLHGSEPSSVKRHDPHAAWLQMCEIAHTSVSTCYV